MCTDGVEANDDFSRLFDPKASTECDAAERGGHNPKRGGGCRGKSSRRWTSVCSCRIVEATRATVVVRARPLMKVRAASLT